MWQVDRWTAPSIFMHIHVSHVKICLSVSSMCRWVNGKVSWREKKHYSCIWTWEVSPKVAEGDKFGVISSLGVRMADRWMAACRKSLCARFTNPLALLKRTIHVLVCLFSLACVLSFLFLFQWSNGKAYKGR